MRTETKYLVNVEGKNAILRVLGHASYLNCVKVGEFFARVAEEGVKEIEVDCKECLGMDSTFLGTLASCALKLRKSEGKMKLSNLNERNMELVKNLGLENIMDVNAIPQTDSPNSHKNDKDENQDLGIGKAAAENILDAHESLVKVSPENEAKFVDVISFLKKETKK